MSADAGSRLPETSSLLTAVFDESPVATLRTGVSDGRIGVILEANPAAFALLGRAPVIGRRLADLLLAGAAIPVGPGTSRHMVTAPELASDAVRWLALTVVPLSPLASPGAPAALVLLEDVTAKRAQDQQLVAAARQDPLTGLGNRDELLRALRSLDPVVDGPSVAVLFCDLDRFKRVNDYRGHQAGDEVLQAVSARVRAAVRPGDTLVRLGGDEFVVLCPRLSGVADARAIAERIRATLQAPLTIGGRDLRMSMSIGLAISPVSDVDAPDLLRNADRAMYAAKQTGRNRVGLYPLGRSDDPWLRRNPLGWARRRGQGDG